MKTENSGGVRTSLTKKIGRPTKEPTRVLNFRVPVKEYNRIKILLGEYLASLLNASQHACMCIKRITKPLNNMK